MKAAVAESTGRSRRSQRNTAVVAAKLLIKAASGGQRRATDEPKSPLMVCGGNPMRGHEAALDNIPTSRYATKQRCAELRGPSHGYHSRRHPDCLLRRWRRLGLPEHRQLRAPAR